MEKKIFELGLIKGRHEMPVQDYIFSSEIEDPMDFNRIEVDIHKALICRFGLTLREGTGSLPNQTEFTSVPCTVGDQVLIVYVTGLTPVTVALINWCRFHGQELILMHFNKATGAYVAQRVVL